MRVSLRSALGALLLFLSAGCGGGAVTVEGVVSFNGVPVDSGAVVFVPADDKKPKKGARIFDGKYKVEASDEMEPGKYKVILNWNKKTGKKTSTGDGAEKQDETKEGLPAQFNTNTTQTAEVTGGANKIDFVLTDAGKK
jgi:hypothetical protein